MSILCENRCVILHANKLSRNLHRRRGNFFKKIVVLSRSLFTERSPRRQPNSKFVFQTYGSLRAAQSGGYHRPDAIYFSENCVTERNTRTFPTTDCIRVIKQSSRRASGGTILRSSLSLHKPSPVPSSEP